eukprot:Hpha_TRINITY_DN16175_c3_g2::TRINITY_DN16175_c3_g2_i1::g.6833::m.6833
MFRVAMRCAAVRPVRAFAPLRMASTGPDTLRSLGKTQETVADMFQRFDTSGDGLLQPDEMQQLLKSQGCVMTIDQVKVLMASLDSDGDGNISLSELESFIFPVDLEGGGDGPNVRMEEDEMRERAALG